MSNSTMEPPKGEILIYEGADKSIQIEVRSDGDTVWLTENQVAVLFDTTRQNINLHVQNVIQDGELERLATCKESLQVRKEGNHVFSRYEYVGRRRRRMSTYNIVVSMDEQTVVSEYIPSAVRVFDY